MKGAPLIGVAVLVVHAGAFVAMARTCEPSALSVTIARSPGSPLGVTADIAPGIRDRATAYVDGNRVESLAKARVASGMHRVEWVVAYRGGFDRRVGYTTTTGPYQEAEAPPCSVRLHIGQAFLDDGQGSDHTLSGLVARVVSDELAGLEVRGVGKFRRAGAVSMRWASEAGGSLRVDLELLFEDAKVPVTIIGVPTLEGGALDWTTSTTARVRLNSSVERWVLSTLRLQDNLDDAATTIGDKHVQKVAAGLRDAFAVPPPVTVGGRAIAFRYCTDEPIRITDRNSASVPLALVPLEGGLTQPIKLARSGRPPPLLDSSTPLAFDFDLDAVNAVLHLLWETGALDRAIERRRFADWFNESDLVKRFLSVRVEGLGLSMPPAFERNRGPRSPFAIGAEAHLTMVEGDVRTKAHLFGRVGVDVATNDEGRLEPRLHLSDLALSCEPEPGVLEPCYGAIVAAAKRYAPDLHGPVAAAFSKRFDALVRGRRLGVAGDPTEFAIESARVTAYPDGASGWIRVGLAGRISGPGPNAPPE